MKYVKIQLTDLSKAERASVEKIRRKKNEQV